MYVVYSKETTDSVVHVTRKKRHLQTNHASGSGGLYLFPLSDMSPATSDCLEPHFSRSLFFSSSPFLLLLSYFLLWFSKTAADYTAVENLGGGL